MCCAARMPQAHCIISKVNSTNSERYKGHGRQTIDPGSRRTLMLTSELLSVTNKQKNMNSFLMDKYVDMRHRNTAKLFGRQEDSANSQQDTSNHDGSGQTTGSRGEKLSTSNTQTPALVSNYGSSHCNLLFSLSCSERAVKGK